MPPLRFAAGAVGAVAVGHIIVSEIAVLKAVMARPEPRPRPSVVGCKRTAALTEVVSAMYSGGDLETKVQTYLADDVTFTDPAAACRGRPEVVEAFRALGAFCSPEHIEGPLPLSSFESSPSAVTFDLHQRYFRGSVFVPQGLEIRSTLQVQCSDDGRIRSIEERWNDAALLQFAAFRWARRANGIVSYAVTSCLARK
jgi:hypothetical protein